FLWKMSARATPTGNTPLTEHRSRPQRFLAPARSGRAYLVARCASARSGGTRVFRPSAVHVAEVDAADFRVADDVLGLALEQDGAARDDRGVVDDLQRLADVVVGDQDADALARQIADDLADVGDGQGV